MPKLFIDSQGLDDAHYAFMDAAGNIHFSSIHTADLADGCTATDIYQHNPMGDGHLVATIKWPSNTFRDPVLVIYPTEETGSTTKLHLSTNPLRQSLNITTQGHSQAHWRRIPETRKLALFAGRNKEKRLIADECQRAGKRWLQIEAKPVHHCTITDLEIVATWIAVNKLTCPSKGLFSLVLPRYLSRCFSISNQA